MGNHGFGLSHLYSPGSVSFSAECCITVGILKNVDWPCSDRGCESGLRNRLEEIFLKAIERVLWIAYGNHSASADTRDDAEKILERLENSGLVHRDELMQVVDLDPSLDSDCSSFSHLLAPLRGSNKIDPLNIQFVTRRLLDGDPYYRVSRDAFDASFEKMKSDILYLLEGEASSDCVPERIMSQLVGLSYGNHAKTGKQRDNARVLLEFLLAHGESKKQDLMSAIDLDPGDENADKRFLRTVQWLTGNWDEKPKSPMHIENHGFVLSRRVSDGDAYYSLAPGEFRRSTNVVKKSVRNLLSQDA